MNSTRLTTLVAVLSLALSQARGGEIAAFVEPYRDVDVASSELGTVAYLNVEEGDRVQEGQVLAGLDEAVLNAALEVAKTAKEALGRLRSAEAELEMRVDRLKKIQQLVERRHASQEELARAASQVEIAKAQVIAVQEELAVKSAEYNRIQAQINQKRIKSPIDGVVTRVFKDAGEFVSASDPTIVKVVQLSQLKVEFSVPASAAREFKPGQRITLEVGRERQERPGVVEYVSPTTDAQSNTVRVKIRVDNQSGLMRGGDTCWLAISGSVDDAVPAGQLTTRKKTLVNAN